MGAPASALHQWPRTKAKTFNAHNKQNRQKKHTTGVKPSPARPYVSTCILCIYWGHTLTHTRTHSHTRGGGFAPFIRVWQPHGSAPSQNTWAVLILQQASKALHQTQKKEIHSHPPRPSRRLLLCHLIFFPSFFFLNCRHGTVRIKFVDAAFRSGVCQSQKDRIKVKNKQTKKSTWNHTQIDICTRDPQTENHETWFACYYLCYLQQEEIQIVIQSNKLKGKWDAARWCHI